MKKLIAVFAVLLFAAPAFAAADWAFYGSTRVQTFYTSQYRANTSVDTDLGHNLQTNSRFGARVKADKVTGQVELSQRSLDSSDNTVRTRIMRGQWNFSDNGFLMIGRDWSILDMSETSNQVYASDNDLVGYAATGNRVDQVTLGLGNFQFSLVQPMTSNTWNPNTNTVTNDTKLPKFEAVYNIPLDNFTIRFGGGYQYLEATDATGKLEQVNSYILEMLLKAKFGAFYIGGSGFYGVNTNNANWCNGGVNQQAIYSTAFFKPGGGVDDSTSYGAGGALGLNFTDSIIFEVGGGYRVDDNDSAVKGAEGWYSAYANVTYKFAPGCKITPEVGMFSNQDSPTTGLTGGTDLYAGLQWRIDF